MFPLLYHAHHSLHREDIPFWVGLAEGSPDPVLELGCGSGRVLAALDQAGKRVFGLDLDIGMLKVLREYLPEISTVRNRVFQADFTAFRLAARFGLILLPCNTYSTLTSLERTRLLECVIDHLNPGGIFATSLPNPILLRSLPKRADPEIEEIFPHPLDKEPVQVSSEWQRDRTSLTLQWHYDHLLPEGQVERVTAQVIHQLTPVETYQQELQSVGFRDLKMIGDFDGSIYTASSPQLIILAAQ